MHAFIKLAVEVGAVIQADGAAAAERDRQFAAGHPQLFNYPQPQLGPGVHTNTLPAGLILPQPMLDGIRLDDIAGDGFALIAPDEVTSAVGEEIRLAWKDLGVVNVWHPLLAPWLAEHGAVAAVLRPDRYLFGLASTPRQLEPLTALLQQACRSGG